jgi:hypothetical protein
MEKERATADPFWGIVQDFELSSDTLALIAAVEDDHLKENIDWQYVHKPNIETIIKHDNQMIDYLREVHSLPLNLCGPVLEYHFSRMNNQGSSING